MCCSGKSLEQEIKENRDFIVSEINRGNINKVYKFKTTLLIKAIRGNFLNLVLNLINKGADVNYKGFQGHTVLMGAVYPAKEDIVKVLIENGANVNDSDIFGSTVLMEAVLGGNLRVIKLLLDNGADLKAKDNMGQDVFKYAGYGDEREEILSLLRKYEK